MCNLQQFIEHCQHHDTPDPAWSSPLRALWYAEKGEWERAHVLCQQGDLPEGAWVHANLHREEGDVSNARYWYHRAGKPESDLGVREERHDIITRLLRDS